MIIDKLPFAVPSDPIVEARVKAIREDGGEPFYAYQIPQAALALKQGFGRLIRSRSDRGVAVDPGQPDHEAALWPGILRQPAGLSLYHGYPRCRGFLALLSSGRAVP